MKLAKPLFIRAERVFNLKKNLYDIFWGLVEKVAKKSTKAFKYLAF